MATQVKQVKKGRTLEEWKRLGKLLSGARVLLVVSQLHASRIMTKRECYQLDYAFDRLHHFIGNAEDIMCKQLPAESERSWDIFYGYDSVQNPLLKEAQKFEKEDALNPIEKQCPDFAKHLYEVAETFQDGMNYVLEHFGLEPIRQVENESRS